MARGKDSPRAVIALAGRRIDQPGTQPPRFPLGNVPKVKRRLARAFSKLNAVAIVCSAACGADLVALEEAERLGLRRRIVLPFSPPLFLETSVVDRPGDWESLFRTQIANTTASGDLVVLELSPGDDGAYASTNEAIIREAQTLALRSIRDGSSRLVAVIVWEGAPRSNSDATAGFRDLARRAGFEEQWVLTL